MLMSVALRRLEDAIQERKGSGQWPRVVWQVHPNVETIDLTYIARRRDIHALGAWSPATFWHDIGGDFLVSSAGFRVVETCPKCDTDWLGEWFLEGVYRVIPADGSNLQNDLPPHNLEHLKIE